MQFVSGTHETPDGQAIAEWFGEFVGRPQYAPYVALGWHDRGVLRSAVLFTDYTGANIELHMVGRLTRQMLREGLRYAFEFLKVQRITAKPYRCNIPLRETVVRLGFEPEGVMKRYYGPDPEHDAMLFRLDRRSAEKWMT